jgi:hypothetical protein
MRLAPLLCATVLAVGPFQSTTRLHAQRAPEAQELIDRWVEAIGGMDNYHRVQSVSYTVTTEMYDPESGRLRRTRPRYATIARDASGLYSRVERWEGDDFIQQGWHPGGQWAFLNGEPLAEGDKDWDEADYVGGDLNYWIFLPYKLNDDGVHLEYSSDDGRGRRLVTVTFGEGIGSSRDTWRYHFEGDRTWPAEVSYQTERGTRPSPMRWTDIGVADGFFYVGSRVYLDPEGRVRMIVRISDVSINPELDPEVFLRP